MKVLVTGGRDFRDHDWLFAGLDLLNEVTGGISELIEGGASGADCLAANWAIWKKDRTGKPEHVKVPAKWGEYGRRAGYIRNAEMAALKPDIVLACPGGKGTANMVTIAKANGLKVVFLEKMPIAKGATPCATGAAPPTS